MESYLLGFLELKRISAAVYVITLADHVAFTETLQQHKKVLLFSLQRMADCYKPLFTVVVQRATLDRYMELLLRLTQGLRKTCECSFLKATEEAQVE